MAQIPTNRYEIVNEDACVTVTIIASINNTIVSDTLPIKISDAIKIEEIFKRLIDIYGEDAKIGPKILINVSVL